MDLCTGRKSDQSGGMRRIDMSGQLDQVKALAAEVEKAPLMEVKKKVSELVAAMIVWMEQQEKKHG